MTVELLSSRRVACVLIALLATAGAGQASPPPPAGPSLLIKGAPDATTGRRSSVRLTLADLEALPQHAFSTRSPWSKEARHYAGPLLRDVLQRAGVHGKTIHAAALNDYQITIPIEDVRQDVIVAVRVDGKPIPVREQGPFFVIYPFDQKPELRQSRYYQRSIWQLKSLRLD